MLGCSFICERPCYVASPGLQSWANRDRRVSTHIIRSKWFWDNQDAGKVKVQFFSAEKLIGICLVFQENVEVFLRLLFKDDEEA